MGLERSRSVPVVGEAVPSTPGPHAVQDAGIGDAEFLAISATRRPWSSRDRTLFARIAAELRRVILGNHRCVDDWYPLILRQMVVAAVGSGEQERARIQDNPHRSKDWSIAVHS